MTRFFDNNPSGHSLGPIGKRGGGFKPFKSMKPTNNPGGKGKKDTVAGVTSAFTDASVAAATQLAVTLPSGISAGDLLVAHGWFSGATGAFPVASGWHKAYYQSPGGLDVRPFTFCKIATGSDALTVVLGDTATTFTGVNVLNFGGGVNWVDAKVIEASGSSPYDPASFTFTGTGATSVITVSQLSAKQDPATYPADYTYVGASGNASGCTQTFYKAGVTSPEDPGSWTVTGGPFSIIAPTLAVSSVSKSTPGTEAHRYWRMVVTATQGGIDSTGIKHLYLCSGFNGDVLTTLRDDATVTASSTLLTYTIDRAFGRIPASTIFYQSNALPTISVDLGAGNTDTINSVLIECKASDPDTNPKTFSIDYSDNGVDYTTYFIVADSGLVGGGARGYFNKT